MLARPKSLFTPDRSVNWKAQRMFSGLTGGYNPFQKVYGDNDALFPQYWAAEALLFLKEAIMLPRLVYRDFESSLQNNGDTVHCHRPNVFKMKRKMPDNALTTQTASVTNVDVKLNQQATVSYTLRDTDKSLSFKNLVNLYIAPAAHALAQGIDITLLGQYPQFLANTVGGLNQMTGDNADTFLTYVREKFNLNDVPMEGRFIMDNVVTDTKLTQVGLFMDASQVGDSGEALKKAYIGEKYGFNHFMAKNMAQFQFRNAAQVDKNGKVNLAAGYQAGTTTLAMDGISSGVEPAANMWITIAGDDTPLRVVSNTGGTTPTAIVLASPGLRYPVANDAVITIYKTGAVNLVAGYAVGWADPIAVDGFTEMPKVGQFVTFHSSPTSPIYTIIDADATTITLDRPLEVALANDQTVNPGPEGNYNLALVRDAIAFVVRPMAPPASQVASYVMIDPVAQLAVRVTLSYDGQYQKDRVTFDFLYGLAILNNKLGAVLCG